MKTIPLTQGQVATIDDADYPLVSQHTWWLDREKHTSYAVTQVGRKTIRMHSLLSRKGKYAPKLAMHCAQCRIEAT